METAAPLKIVTQDEFCIERVPDPCGIVIFGASGDLTHRKLIPSLFELYQSGLLPKGFFILGFARTEENDRIFRRRVLNVLSERKKGDSPIEIV